MKKFLIMPLCIILTVFFCSGCVFAFKTNKGATEHYTVEYTDEGVDRNALDAYFTANTEKYPAYGELKSAAPHLLNNARPIVSSHNFASSLNAIRFSSEGNGFLNSETFICIHGNYYKLGTAAGGHGVTEIIRRHSDAGYWLYFLYSYGEAHQTGIGVFSLIKETFYTVNGLNLPSGKDYSFAVVDNCINLYEATVTPQYDGDGFATFSIVKGALIYEKIDEMKRTEVTP